MTDLPLIHTGKVRKLYRYAPGQILMVATDQISAFDFVLDSEIPDKGKVLTQLSLWWFEQLKDVTENHVLSLGVPEEFAGRGIIVEELEMVPIEAIVRGYLTGSGLIEYRQSSTVCGIKLPAGLEDGSRLPEPIFTPSTKADIGDHDENIDYASAVRLVGEGIAAKVRDVSLAIYTRAEEIARERGIILADTKFEFGVREDGALVLADEVLTPDSSRFWEASTWKPGGSQPSFDKQYVRDWLTKDSGWDRASGAKPPALPEEVIAATRGRYLDAYRRLSGKGLIS
jgi:phosphoribosylaminoimidazole-succinocarboxamide synthase